MTRGDCQSLGLRARRRAWCRPGAAHPFFMQRIALRLPRLAAVRSASTLASGAAVESAVPAAISCLRHAAAARLAADGLGAPAARDSVWDAPGAPSSVYDSVIGDCFVPSGEAVRTPASSWLDEVVGEAPAIQAMNRNARQPKKVRACVSLDSFDFIRKDHDVWWGLAVFLFAYTRSHSPRLPTTLSLSPLAEQPRQAPVLQRAPEA